MFKPPARLPVHQFRQDSKNILLTAITGDKIHCRLVCPWDQDTQLAPYTGTKSLIIFMHGNADDISSCKSYCQWLADVVHSNILVFDYPGYGFSSGEDNTTEEGMTDAAVAVMEFAITKLRHDLSDIVIIGKSIGSFPAVSLAAHPAFCAHIRGLVLVSPVASAARCIFDRKMIPNFLLQRLDAVALANINSIRNIRCPVFFVHGTRDDVVSVDNSYELLAASASDFPPLWVDAGHNDIESRFQSLFVSSLKDFLQCCQTDIENKTAHSPYDAFGFS
jgi:pimeloyl-ACP methyl ester carboxylesterase